ncbi:MAG: mechanosensitive ion channel protein MscS, partial [Pseudomonadota bacterium]
MIQAEGEPTPTEGEANGDSAQSANDAAATDGTAPDAVDAAVSATPPDAPIDENGSALEALVGADRLREQGLSLLQWARDNLLTLDVAIEATILVAALAPAALFGPRLQKFIITQIAPRAPLGLLRRAANAFAHIATPIALYLILTAAVVALSAAGRETGLVSAGVSLLTAWIVIRLVTLVIRSPLWSRVAFYIVWPLAALDAFGVLDNVVAQLDAFAIPLSTNEAGRTVDISALDVVRGALTFAVLFWLASVAGNFLKGRIDAADELTVSFKALLA